ncbi:putative quinol monooxygenase [Edaphosphingomonas haloaromaticamans]|uniref:ABM domain-containing protein n=1 Tax=Edaphosphingomonas haloaromaticamans TaxID=653954 RepID=A0A1S1HGM9_9SPHN|nr:hypothetical protein [Sphingomonas haloaromaticamans]OHT20641.1 hypothetical protein BHE75_02640 [Sphingomonas haloaromaticamans]
MWMRSAFWIGTPKPGQEASFRNAIDGDLVPGLKALPGVLDSWALWPERNEPLAPRIACQILVKFESEEAVDRMLASPERAELRKRVVPIVAMFDGEFCHIDFSVG